MLAAADKPSREIQELQRDLAQLQESVKSLQRALEDRIAGLDKQVQAASASADRAGEAATGVQSSVERLSKDLQQRLAPVGQISGSVEHLSGSLGAMQQAIADLTSVVNKLQGQVGDLTMAVKASQQPAAAPPPPMSASDMMINADRDLMSGKYDLAISEYEEYLKWYADSPQADLAHYAIGSAHLALKNNEKAVEAFNTMLTKYPESVKTPEALFYKAKALDAMNRLKESADVRAELRRRFPKHSLANRR